MNSYINSTDTLMHTNNLIQKREISSTDSTLNPIQSIIIRKRKNSSSIACNLSNKSIKMDHEGSMEYRIYKSQIDHLFNNIFANSFTEPLLALGFKFLYVFPPNVISSFDSASNLTQ